MRIINKNSYLNIYIKREENINIDRMIIIYDLLIKLYLIIFEYFI